MLDKILLRVTKPVRYSGGEYGSIIKNPKRGKSYAYNK